MDASGRQDVLAAGKWADLQVLPVFATTLFLSALLLFWVQPMFAKMVLPLLGGAPGVWNTAMLFFQTALLAGYAYAHLTSRWLGLRWQVLLHVALLALAALALPIAVAPGWTPPTEGRPVIWLIGLFAISVGLPFFAVSATAPLLQRWFSHSGHETANDPYHLYGASNVGSILALLGYPVLVEPTLTLAGQSGSWAFGYAVLSLMIVLCGVYLWRAAAGHGWRVGRPVVLVAPVPVPWTRRLHWLALAFVPSSLLLGVTSHITNDIAAVPLFWLIPLTLYLLTFVLTFSHRPILKPEWLLRIQPPLLVFAAALLLMRSPLLPLTLLHLAIFFVCAMVCHGELWRKRPHADHLTEFYLWMSFGGMLGGVFNALLSPVLFDSVIEYPLAIIAACALRRWQPLATRRPSPALVLAMVAPLLLILPVAIQLGFIAAKAWQVLSLVSIIALALTIRFHSGQPAVFAASIAGIILLAPVFGSGQDGVFLARERSFFGVYAVKSVNDGRTNILIHGTTVHGAQHVDAGRRREPVTYYNRAGPVGSVFERLPATAGPRSVGIVGLGIGTMACYRRPGEDWRFYEIDPAITALARDERLFRYLADCAPDAPIIHGDARLSLEGAADGRFDLLVMDAFSSDSVPVHLMTREALNLYLRKLADGGLLLVNVSNRNVDLAQVLSSVVAELGLAARHQRHQPTPPQLDEAYAVSEWAIVARDESTLTIFDDDPRWTALPPGGGMRAWSDDFSNIVGALRWW